MRFGPPLLCANPNALLLAALTFVNAAPQRNSRDPYRPWEMPASVDNRDRGDS